MNTKVLASIIVIAGLVGAGWYYMNQVEANPDYICKGIIRNPVCEFTGNYDSCTWNGNGTGTCDGKRKAYLTYSSHRVTCNNSNNAGNATVYDAVRDSLSGSVETIWSADGDGSETRQYNLGYTYEACRVDNVPAPLSNNTQNTGTGVTASGQYVESETSSGATTGSGQ